MFKTYYGEKRKIESQTIVISGKHQQRPQDKRQDFRGGSELGLGFHGQLSDPVKLQFFYDKGKVAGFGWLNDTMFCYGQY